MNLSLESAINLKDIRSVICLKRSANLRNVERNLLIYSTLKAVNESGGYVRET